MSDNAELFRQRLLKQILWFVIAISGTNIVGNMAIRYPMSANIKWTVGIVLAWLILRYGLESKYYELIVFSLFLVVTFVFFPLGWYGSGLESNNVIGYAFLLVMGYIILFRGFKRWFLLASVVVLFVAFQFLEFYFPEHMIVHPRSLLFVDRLIQIPLVLGASMAMMIQYVNIFYSKNDELEELNSKFRTLAFTDSLTGLGNRALIFDKLEALVDDQKQFTTLMIDLDNFKQVNDTYGHIEGDRLLVKVADQLRASFPDGLVARYGGDEFIIILFEDKNKVSSMVETFLDDTRHDELLSGYGATISGGYSSYNGRGTLDKFLRLVDTTLYSAKGSGKNQILYQENPEK